MQRTVTTLQVIMLGITMALGAMLKMDVFESARLLHRSVSVLTLVLTLATMVIIVSQQATSLVTGLVIAAFGATLLASIGGNLTRTSRYDLGYTLMLTAFVVALGTSIAARYMLRGAPKPIVEK